MDNEITDFILNNCQYLNDNGTIRKIRKRFGLGFVHARALLHELPIERDELGRWVKSS